MMHESHACILNFWHELHSSSIQQLYELNPHQNHPVLINRK